MTTQSAYQDFQQLHALATGATEAAEGHVPDLGYQHFANCIGTAAQQLEIAHLGWRQYTRAVPKGDDNHLNEELWLVRLMALNLACRCVVTALDLCTSALCIRKGCLPDDPQAEGKPFLDVRDKTRVTKWLDPGDPDRKWWDAVRGSHEWHLLLGCRDAVTHRWVPLSTTVGGRAAGTDVRILGKRHLVDDLGPRFLQFGFDRFRECCEVLEPYPG